MITTSKTEQLRALLDDRQKSGQLVISTKEVLRLLGSVQSDNTQNFERQKAEHQTEIEAFKVNANAKVENFRSVIETAKVALSASILINGGATVALLTFLGNMMKLSAAGTHIPRGFVMSAGGFATGVLFGAFATGATYLVQFYFNEGNESRGWRFRVWAMIFVLLSYVSFFIGITAALVAFSTV